MTTLNPDAVPWRPEGSGPATRFGGATQFLALQHPSMAKPSGLGPTSEHLEHQNPQHRKKSYIRALKRAHLHGHTWHRGRLLTAAMLGIDETPQPRPQDTLSSSQTPNTPPPAKVRKNRLTGFCWNICSLSNYKFDILRQWMLSQHLDIMILQDTRWGFSGDWSDKHYAYIHSGSTGKTGGMMTIIRKGFCDLDRISWRAVVPGRLLHVRLYLPSTGIDIINAYQHAWIQNDPVCLQHRRALLHACKQLVAGLPQRNVVILGGDLNTSLHRTPHCVGLSDFQDDKGRRSGPRHPDSNLLGDLLLQHGLTAINTWDTNLGPTYTGGHSNKSRIDFVLVRHKSSDSLTKKPVYLDELPQKFGHSKDHVPILFTVPYKWRAWAKPASGLSRGQHDLLLRHWELQSEDWNSLCSSIEHKIGLLWDQPPDLEALNTVLLDGCKDFAPLSRGQQDRPSNFWSWADGHPGLSLPPVATRTHFTSRLQQLFGLWAKAAKIQRWKRTTNQRAKAAKKAKLSDTIAEARWHWANNASHRYFKVVNRLTPKVRPPRPQLRRSEGQLMAPEEELCWIQDYMADLYAGSDLTGIQFQLEALPFDATDLTHELQGLYGRTSVPQHIAPSFIWKALALSVGPLVFTWLEQWMHSGIIPHEWRKGWVVLLPKPNKPPTEPKALRPIALQTPLSKTVMSLFVHEARKITLPALTWFPQFAYLPGRGTWEAITRVQAHSREVSELHRRWRYDASQVNGHGGKRPLLFGGCQLFLDLTGAFDAMPREHLAAAFSLLGLPNELTSLLMKWHTETSYIIQWKGISAEQATFRGVRQGCRGVPFFWASFIALILQMVATETSEDWMRKHCTFYADDGHACFVFRTFEELQQGLVFFGKLISVLERMGMTVNMQKSAVILRWGGKHQSLAKKRFVQKQLDRSVLLIPKAEGGSHAIPITEKHEYLGVQMGYHNFQRDTMKARLQACKVRFKQMQPWFTKNGMHSAQKVALWQTCIFPIGVYGLDATGVDHASIPMFSKTMTTMLRQAAGDHSFLTHTTHLDFLTDNHLRHPALLLRERMASQVKRHEDRIQLLEAHDILQHLDLHALDTSINLVDAWLQDLGDLDLQPKLPLAEAGLDCHQCGQTFQFLYTLRRHELFVHGILHGAGPALDIARDAVEGKPTCRHCGDSFISWQNFRHHISSYACSEFDSTKAPPAQLQEHRQRLLAYFDEGDMAPLANDRSLCYFLTQRCILCGFWSSRLQQMSAHMGRDHGDIYGMMGDVLPNVVRARTNSPCELCGQEFRSKTHTCPVKKQLGLALAYRKHREQYPACPPPVLQPPQRMDAQFACAQCPRKFVTAAGLNQHQAMEHQHSTTTRTFMAARDQVPGLTQCAHCSASFLCLAALRHHIDGGQCPEPLPDAPPLLWHHPLVISGLHGGTYDHLMAYKSLIRRLGYIWGLCGHQSSSSSSLLKHLSTAHATTWTMASSYAEWLQTDSALRNLACSCLRPPSTPHVCTVFTQLALFVHHDLYKLQNASDELILAHALRLDLQALSPTLALNFPDLDSMLTTGNFEELLSDSALCTALSTWCCLCGRQVDPRDMLQHIWNNHSKQGNRGALFYKFLSFSQKRQQTCSICSNHPTAVQCPVLLQLSGLLAILHHGHGGQPDLGHVGSSEPMGEDGGGRGQAERKAPEVFHVEWREGAGQRKRKKRPGEDPEHQGRTHTRYKDAPSSHDPTRPSARRHTPMPGYGDGLLRFLRVGPGSLIPLMMAQTQTWQQTPQAERTHPLRILVLKTLLEELLKRIQKLQSTGSSEPLIQTLQRLNFLQLEPEKPESYMFPRMKWNSSKQAMEAQEDAPLTLTQASQTVTRMLTLLQQEALVKRFGALRSPHHIQKVMTTETETPSAIIPWRITLALVHPHANEMRGLWHQLSHSGLWQLVLGRMRSASIHRTPLAQHLGKMLDQL